MALTGDKKEKSEGLGRLLNLGRRFLAGEEAPQSKPRAERRVSNRVPLPLAVRVRVGQGRFRLARLRDVNQPGLAVEPAEDARLNQPVAVVFDGYPGVAPAFTLMGNVVRLIGGDEKAMGIKVDRKSTAPEALRHYRSLVLHYVHHRPLLEEVNSGYFEGRCTTCGWMGRVGRRAPRCSHCGQKVVPI